jgi:hypothetical protein
MLRFYDIIINIRVVANVECINIPNLVAISSSVFLYNDDA